MNNVAGWEELKKSLPVGSMVSGIATRQPPFGVFVKITGVSFDGRIQITDFKDTGRMTPDEFPAIGTSLQAVVLGFKEDERQIWLGVRPSQIDKAEKKQRSEIEPAMSDILGECGSSGPSGRGWAGEKLDLARLNDHPGFVACVVPATLWSFSYANGVQHQSPGSRSAPWVASRVAHAPHRSTKRERVHWLWEPLARASGS